jgi:hypothetical protein
MKKVLLVLSLVLLSSLVFAEQNPLGPPADPPGASLEDPNMFLYMWRFMVNQEVQGQPGDPIQFMKQVRLGDPDAEPAGSEAPKEPDRLQTQEKVQEKLQDGSCNDEPEQKRSQSGR